MYEVNLWQGPSYFALSAAEYRVVMECQLRDMFVVKLGVFFLGAITP